MKKYLLITVLLALIFTVYSCKKDGNLIKMSPSKVEKKQESKYSYVDTVTQKRPIQKLAKTITANDVYTPDYVVDYAGNGNYQIYVNTALGTKVVKTFLLYRNGSLYESLGSTSSQNLTLIRALPPGGYFITIEYNSGNGGISYTTTANIVAAPVVPAGTIALIRYYNPVLGKHFYSNNFEELGSHRLGYVYEKVTGYLHTSPTNPSVPFTDRPIYQYYNSANGDHKYTDIYGSVLYVGGDVNKKYDFERIIGYSMWSSTGDFNKVMTSYYNSQSQSHYLIASPETPAPNYSLDKTLGYIK